MAWTHAYVCAQAKQEPAHVDFLKNVPPSWIKDKDEPISIEVLFILFFIFVPALCRGMTT